MLSHAIARAPSMEVPGSVRIAVVDDHPNAREGFVRQFSSIPACTVVIVACDGLDFIRQLAEGPAPHIAFIDMRMPNMDGPQLMRWLREHRPEDWSTLTNVEADSLLALASLGSQNSALLVALLNGNGLGVLEPEPLFPNTAKALHGERIDEELPAMPPTLTAYPDPADAHTVLTFPAEWKGSALVVSDVQGREVLRTNLAQAGLHELATDRMANGVYQLHLPQLGVTGRFVVKH